MELPDQIMVRRDPATEEGDVMDIYHRAGENFTRDADDLPLLTEGGVRCGNHERRGHYYHETTDAVRACYALSNWSPLDQGPGDVLAELHRAQAGKPLDDCPICGPLDRCRHHV